MTARMTRSPSPREAPRLSTRRMLRSGRSVTRRRVLITLLAAVALVLRDVGAVLAYVGVASALFGSHGVVRRWQQRADDPSNHDDPDE